MVVYFHWTADIILLVWIYYRNTNKLRTKMKIVLKEFKKQIVESKPLI